MQLIVGMNVQSFKVLGIDWRTDKRCGQAEAPHACPIIFQEHNALCHDGTCVDNRVAWCPGSGQTRLVKQAHQIRPRSDAQRIAAAAVPLLAGLLHAQEHSSPIKTLSQAISTIRPSELFSYLSGCSWLYLKHAAKLLVGRLCSACHSAAKHAESCRLQNTKAFRLQQSANAFTHCLHALLDLNHHAPQSI